MDEQKKQPTPKPKATTAAKKPAAKAADTTQMDVLIELVKEMRDIKNMMMTGPAAPAPQPQAAPAPAPVQAPPPPVSAAPAPAPVQQAPVQAPTPPPVAPPVQQQTPPPAPATPAQPAQKVITPNVDLGNVVAAPRVAGAPEFGEKLEASSDDDLIDDGKMTDEEYKQYVLYKALAEIDKFSKPDVNYEDDGQDDNNDDFGTVGVFTDGDDFGSLNT
ncbi:MAG: hypothetical protein FWC00_05520 [Firmicutes bacterium]|nr:hypothetical protein [Bacillota bacterium]